MVGLLARGIKHQKCLPCAEILPYPLDLNQLNEFDSITVARTVQRIQRAPGRPADLLPPFDPSAARDPPLANGIEETWRDSSGHQSPWSRSALRPVSGVFILTKINAG